MATIGTLTFAPGETKKTITVLINGDTMYEANETFRVLLVGATNATIKRGIATGTIRNDDTKPSLTIGDVSVDENGGTAVFTVSLSAASGLPVTVKYSTANGTAIAGSDYAATSGALTFAPGTTTQTISVPILDNTSHESNETFNLSLSGAVGPPWLGPRPLRRLSTTIRPRDPGSFQPCKLCRESKSPDGLNVNGDDAPTGANAAYDWRLESILETVLQERLAVAGIENEE